MAIRVTQTMLNNNMLRNLTNSMGKMDKLQEQLSSGMLISRPSDDPVIASRAMLYRSNLAEIEQFQRNVSEARSWMELSDQSLDEAGTILQRVQELVVYSGNVALETDSLEAIAKEIEQLKEHLGNIANQTVAGSYIFAGTDTKTAPYDPAAGDFTKGNAEQIVLELNKSIYVPVNVNGQQIFNFPDKDNNIFKLLDSVIADLKAGKSAKDRIPDLTRQMDNLLAERASLGARINRLDLIDERLANEETNIQTLKSENEDADVAKVITELKTQENVHRAALGAGARIIQPSLLDFLR
jgi:flagellar hook-associated protein 3 FlgL